MDWKELTDFHWHGSDGQMDYRLWVLGDDEYDGSVSLWQGEARVVLVRTAKFHAKSIQEAQERLVKDAKKLTKEFNSALE